MFTSKMSFSERQIFIARLQILVYFIFSILLLWVGFKLLLSEKNEENFKNVYVWFGLIFACIGMVFEYFYIKISKKMDVFLDKKIAQIGTGKKGMEGEAIVLKKLNDIFGDEYEVHPNFKIPGRNFDIDFVVVGPKGIIIFEVKNFSEQINFLEKRAIKIKKTDYTTENTDLVGRADPRNQVIRHSDILKQYLIDLGFGDVIIKKALIFVEDKAIIKGKPGVFIISGINNITKFTNNLSDDGKFTAEFCKRVNSAFAKK